MENQEYITVKEFAERAGVSAQAVYKALNKKLSPYLKEVDGKKMLNIQALQDIYGISGIKEDEQNIDNELISFLKDQLKVKDRQITELQKLLDQQQQLTLKAQLRLEMIEQKEADPEPDQQPEQAHKSIWQRLKEFLN